MNIPKSTGPLDLLITKLAGPPENITVGTSRIAKSISRADFTNIAFLRLSLNQSQTSNDR